jgi:carbon-monoxide dehydrogenase large subunit
VVRCIKSNPKWGRQMKSKVEKFGSSRPLSRSEDSRLLSGKGTFIDSIAPNGALYACFFRSPVAHASISALNLAQAKEAPGVHLVLAAGDLHGAGITEGLPFDVIDNRDGSKSAAPRRPLLAEGKVRFVGEPVAVVFADTLFQAQEACELIGFDFDLLPAHVTPIPGGEALHTQAEDNCAFDWAIGDEDTCAGAFQRAAYYVRKSIRNNRVIVNTIEPRGCFAEVSGGRLHVAVNGQGVMATRDSIAHILGLPPEQVRVTTPDVGGGFGMKAMSYPEPFLVAHAARTLQHSVRWMSERIEAMLTDTGARDLIHDVEMAFDEDYKLAAYRVNTNCNLGAYNSDLGQCIQTTYFAMVLAGAYDVQNTFLNVKGIFTNSAPTDAYRGAGRAEAIYVLERMMDYAARDLGVNAWDLRRRNFIQPHQFPYTSSTGEVYDAANYDLVMTRAAECADLRGFESRKAESLAAGKLRGLGLSYYMMNAIGSSEVSTRMAFPGDGSVTLSVPSQSSGQGHESVFAAFLSDQIGVNSDKIRIIQGDSDEVVRGGGTGGSSSATIVANATLVTVEKAIAAFLPFLAEQMQAGIDHLEFDGQTFRTPGSNLTPTLLEAAELARAAGRHDLLSHQGIGKISSWAFPNGAHVAEVEVDPETGRVTLERYTVVDDFGNLINPLLVEGQVHGGCAQGIGQALMENAVFDEDGQLLSASFMDYAMPRADDLPMFSFTSEPVPSTANVMGIKGCGEAGTVGAVSATANAVTDALWESGAKIFDIPFSSFKVWELLHERRSNQ